ncbi:unnamed protein product [Auanema sp. JU1783]|nr:unnamed protein product [Auanema sp. JU1783]
MFFHATLARSFINALSLRGDDDFVDRLNYYYTPIMLSIACLIISAKQYGGTPIECWVNPHSRESMEEYIESYCWIQNTYWIPMYENVPDDHTAREEKQIGYYQWVPFILIAEALMFSLPCIFWRLLSWQSGLNIQHLINAACDTQAIVDASDRAKAVEAITTCFVDNLDLQCPSVNIHQRSLLSRIKCNRLLSGHYVSVIYLITKLCYAANVILQFVILNACLKSDDYLLFGFQVLNDLVQGKPWTESGHFPRVTLCDFEVRYVANLNRYTVQCALLINIINEKVFAFLWCWYLILLCITSFSTTAWLLNTGVVNEKVDYVLKYMQIAHSSEQKKLQKFSKETSVERVYSVIPFAPHLLDRFVLNFLKSDGVFILRMMSNHAGDMIVVQVVKNLWQEFRERNWREFEEFEEIKEQHFRFPKSSLISGPTHPRVVTISNPVATMMSDSLTSEKAAYL